MFLIQIYFSQKFFFDKKKSFLIENNFFQIFKLKQLVLTLKQLNLVFVFFFLFKLIGIRLFTDSQIGFLKSTPSPPAGTCIVI